MARLEDFFPKSNNKKFSPVKIGCSVCEARATFDEIYVKTNVNGVVNKSITVQEACKSYKQRIAQITHYLISKGYSIKQD